MTLPPNQSPELRAVHSQFVQNVVNEFHNRYACPISQKVSGGEVWIECYSVTPSRFRSALAFGISHDGVTVAFEGRVQPFIAHPAVRDAEIVRRQAFGLFDDLITERQVAISYWTSDECIAVEFIPHGQVRELLGAWKDAGANRVRVRSWLGTYDYDSANKSLQAGGMEGILPQCLSSEL